MAERFSPGNPEGMREQIRLPENIDENYRKAFDLFVQFCSVQNADFDAYEAGRHLGATFVQGSYKGVEVRFRAPAAIEDDREDILAGLMGPEEGLPTVILKQSSPESHSAIDELIHQIESHGVMVAKAVHTN